MAPPLRRALLALLVVALTLALAAGGVEAAAGRLRARTLQQQPQPQSSSPRIFGSLPDKAGRTSARYKRWLSLVRMGYEGGAVERALAQEKDDVDRAALRLSRDYTGFHGLHCLTKGNCFGDKRHSVFRTPESMSVPVQPPAFQAPPPPSSAQVAARAARQAALDKQTAGIDFSAGLLPPRLDPFEFNRPLTAEQESEDTDHRRDRSALRRSSMSPSEKADAFTKLMRGWLTTIQSPFHTRKADAGPHESDLDKTPLPGDTHPQIVPARMERNDDGSVRTEYYSPALYEGMTAAELARQQAREAQLQQLRAAKGALPYAGRRGAVAHPSGTHMPPMAVGGADLDARGRPLLQPTVPVHSFAPSRPAAMSAAQEQDAELEAAFGGGAEQPLE